jgi:hypothetical protein
LIADELSIPEERICCMESAETCSSHGEIRIWYKLQSEIQERNTISQDSAHFEYGGPSWLV